MRKLVALLSAFMLLGATIPAAANTDRIQHGTGVDRLDPHNSVTVFWTPPTSGERPDKWQVNIHRILGENTLSARCGSENTTIVQTFDVPGTSRGQGSYTATDVREASRFCYTVTSVTGTTVEDVESGSLEQAVTTPGPYFEYLSSLDKISERRTEGEREQTCYTTRGLYTEQPLVLELLGASTVNFDDFVVTGLTWDTRSTITVVCFYIDMIQDNVCEPEEEMYFVVSGATDNRVRFTVEAKKLTFFADRGCTIPETPPTTVIDHPDIQPREVTVTYIGNCVRGTPDFVNVTTTTTSFPVGP